MVLWPEGLRHDTAWHRFRGCFSSALEAPYALAPIPVNGCRNARQSGGKGIAQNYGFARHGGLERSPKGEFQDPHGVAAQFLGCGVVICV